MTTITALPTPPSRDDPTNFASRGDAFLGALPTFVTETNTVAGEVNTNASNAATSASNAATSVSDAAAQVALATAEADAAAASAASALASPGTSAVSTSNLTIGLGSQSLMMTVGKAFVVGQTVTIASTASPNNAMAGAITAHDSGTGALTINSTYVTGSGTYTAWTVSLGAVAVTVDAARTWTTKQTFGADTFRYTDGAGAGKVFTSDAEGDGSWQTAAAGGSLIYLSTVTASNSATVDVETTFDSTYDTYVLEVSGLVAQTNDTILQALLKIGGSYVTSNYYFYLRFGFSSAGSGSTASETSSSLGVTTYIQMARNVGNAAGDSLNLTLKIKNPASTSLGKSFEFSGSAISGTVVRNPGGAAGNTGTSAMTGIRFQMSSGNITSGTFRLYGVKNS